MGEHLIDGEFQSDKYPTCPRGKVPLSCKDPMAQDLLWEYAQRRRGVDAAFPDDLEQALLLARFDKTVKARIRWCCHIRGPDEVYACPDFDTAVRWADMANARDDKEEPLLKAIPAPWPWSDDLHAKELPGAIALWTK